MKRGKFSLSHYKLLSMNMGNLVPVGLTEVLPGDTVQHATSALIRVAPLVAPIMHPVRVRIHHWYVPHRLVWEDFEDFITGGPDGMDDSVFPTINTTDGFAVSSLGDYLGVPPLVANREVSALPFRAYALIFNEWYRDQDLVTPLNISYESGPDVLTNVTLRNCAWEKDYFTSSRPWEQKGPSITIPLGTTAPVLGIATATSATTAGPSTVKDVNSASTPYQQFYQSSSPLYAEAISPNGLLNVRADLSNASAITINALREAMALQRFEEARARYGSRYTEYLRYLGVRSSDARLQRPEYLGGGKQTIQFSEVLTTAETENTPVGSMKGHGISAMRSNRYRRFFEEHGYVMSLMSVIPKTIYSDGLARTWSRRTKEDFFQKELQHIGQQEVFNSEVYMAGASPTGTFGYQDRYDDYRRSESTIAGEFRTTELDYWHMARMFASAPALNSSFVQANPTTRVYAQTDEDQLYVMANHNIQARRLVAQTGKSFIY